MCFIDILNIVCNKNGISSPTVYVGVNKSRINTPIKKFRIIKKILGIGNEEDEDDRSIEFYEILDDICLAQKVYHTMTKYIRLKKSKKTDIEHDLVYNELSLFKEHLKIDIYQEKSIYTFTLRDLHKMWIKSLTENDIMIPTPKKVKNPYNNIVFKPYILYNIYFDMMFKGLSIDPLIHRYFRDNFNLSLFLNNNYIYLHEISIDDYTDEIIETNQNMYSFILLLKTRYPNITNKIYVNNTLPNEIKTICIDKFKKAIKYYCMFCFANDIDSLNSKIGIYENKCIKEVMKINNNIFCRPYLKPTKINGRRVTYEYYYFEDDDIIY